jgi:hypothetical protein
MKLISNMWTADFNALISERASFVLPGIRHTLDHNGNCFEVEIRKPRFEDFVQLAKLNHRWQRKLLGANTSRGDIKSIC